jgi:uncharacterized protein (TIGR03437 family)
MSVFKLQLSAWIMLAGLSWAKSGPVISDFFDDGIMQDVWLEVNPADWADLQAHYLDNTYYPAQFTWNGLTMSIGIRSRGSGSRSPWKPNLLLKFDKYVKKQTFLGEVAIVAKANNQDPSNLRETISFKLFRKMGLPAPRASFARIHLNREFFGLFEMVEYLDEQFLKRTFGENTGYLYEWNSVDVYNFEYRGPNQDEYINFLDLKTSQAGPDMNNFIAFVESINLTSDADFVPAVSKYLDPKIYLTHVATENVLAESDGIVGGTFGMNNVYLYQFDKDTHYQFLPWDKDNTFDWPAWGIWSGLDANVLTHRLLAIPEYNNVYTSSLMKAARLFGGAGGWADGEFNRLYAMIAEDARREPHKQCSVSGIVQPCTAQEFEDSAAYGRSFIAQRSAFVAGSVGADTTNAGNPGITSARVEGSTGPVVAPGVLANIEGVKLGGSASANPSPDLPRSLGSVWVAVDGVRAPLLSTSESSIRLQIPWGTAWGTSTIAVSVNGALSNSLDVPVANAAPVFLAVTHAGGAPVAANNPARRGETLVAYALGLGEVDGAIGIGAVTPTAPLAATIREPRLLIGGSEAHLMFTGLTPGFVGLYQVNFLVPDDCPTGPSVRLVLDLEGMEASWTLAVQ